MSNLSSIVSEDKFRNLQNQSSKRKVVLITGASAGLGLTLAKKLINNDNYFLVLTAREKSQYRFADSLITEVSNIWLRELDVIDHKQITALINEINERLGGVDVLVNNAGVTDRSTVEESNNLYRQYQLDVNYLAPFVLIGKVLPLMRKKRSGRIINISSAGGFMAMPTMSSYSASKFALEGATESLWYEVKPWDIQVTLIIPGFINSDGFSHTTESEKCKKSILDLEGTYHEHYVGMKGLIAKLMGQSFATNDKIAEKIIQTMRSKRPPLRIYVTFDAWLFFLFRKICPPKLYFFITYKLLPNIRGWGKQTYKR